MENPELEALVGAIENLATLPGTVVDLLHLLNEPTTCAADVQKIIERDPAMTANILKLGNSAFYGRQRKMTNVRDSLVLLGNRCVATLGFATGMAPILRRDLKGFGLTRKEYWEHSLIAGAAASEAARRSGLAHFCCEAFTAGLVHDIGWLVIDPWLQKNGIELAGDGLGFGVCDREREKLGFDHAQAGGLLARRWGFPDILVEAVSKHHGAWAESPEDDFVRCVAAGDTIAQALAGPQNAEPDPLVAETMERLGFPVDLVELVEDDLTTNLEQALVRATSSAAVPLG